MNVENLIVCLSMCLSVRLSIPQNYLQQFLKIERTYSSLDKGLKSAGFSE